jgi:Flp pilus assembly protein TadG
MCDNTVMLGFGRGLRRARPARNRQGGGAAVEFAIVLPVFCAVLFGTIDYGWYFYQKFTLASAIRDGVRTGVTVSETASPDSYSTAVTAAKVILDAGSLPSASVTFTGSYNGVSPTRTLTVTGTYTFKPLVGFVKTPSTGISYAMTMLLEIQN